MINQFRYKNLFFLFLINWIILSLSSCREDNGIEAARTGNKPAPLTNIKFNPIAGGARISYDLPTDPDLRYVMAEFNLENGTKLTAKSSVYENSVIVKGFAQIGQHDVVLRAVSVGDVMSDPVSIRVTTGEPSYITIANSFKNDENFRATFGGANVVYENPFADNLVIRVFKREQDSTTMQYSWVRVNETYTKATSGIIRVRDQIGNPDPQATQYALVVRDEWKNLSDTIIRTITPFKELQLTKRIVNRDTSIIRQIHYMDPMYKFTGSFSNGSNFSNPSFFVFNNPTGDYIYNNGAGPDNDPMAMSLFDGSPTLGSHPTGDDYPSGGGKQWWGTGAPIPFSFTIDLGQEVQLSRIKMWPRVSAISNTSIYGLTHIREFEVYGSNNPTRDGDWEAWTLIGTFTSFRPSGLAIGQNSTNDDITFAKRGEDFEVAWPDNSKFRYFRFKVTGTWDGLREKVPGNAQTVAIGELRLFGQ